MQFGRTGPRPPDGRRHRRAIGRSHFARQAGGTGAEEADGQDVAVEVGWRPFSTRERGTPIQFGENPGMPVRARQHFRGANFSIGSRMPRGWDIKRDLDVQTLGRRRISIMEMRALELSGYRQSEIAQLAGISVSYVGVLLRRVRSRTAVRPIHPQTQRRLSLEKMRIMELAGLTHAIIAQRAGITIRQVRSLLSMVRTRRPGRPSVNDPGPRDLIKSVRRVRIRGNEDRVMRQNCQRTRTFTKLANPNLYEVGVVC